MPNNGKGSKATGRQRAKMSEAHKIELRQMAKLDAGARSERGQTDTYWAWNRARLRAVYEAAGWTEEELDEVERS